MTLPNVLSRNTTLEPNRIIFAAPKIPHTLSSFCKTAKKILPAVRAGTPQEGPKEADACAWRLGIWKADEERYHYGVVKGCLLDETDAPVHKASSPPPNPPVKGGGISLICALVEADWVRPLSSGGP